MSCAGLAVLLTHADQLQPTVFGIASGALIAAIALSATLTYRGSGVVNFSVAAMAMYASFIFYDLYANGSLFFPPPIPSWQLVHVNVASSGVRLPPFPLWVAFVLTMVECAVLGLLFHLLVFRPLRKSPPLAKVAASIGLFLVLFSTITVRFPSSEGYSFPSILPQGTWYFDSVIDPDQPGPARAHRHRRWPRSSGRSSSSRGSASRRGRRQRTSVAPSSWATTPTGSRR